MTDICRVQAWVLSLCAAAGLAGCGKRAVEITTISHNVPVREKNSAAATLYGYLPLGTRVKGIPMGNGATPTVYNIPFHDDRAVIRASDVAPYPLQGDPCRTNTDVDVRSGGGNTDPVTGRLSANQQVLCTARFTSPEWVGIIEKGVLLGFVPASAVGAGNTAVPPTAPRKTVEETPDDPAAVVRELRNVSNTVGRGNGADLTGLSFPEGSSLDARAGIITVNYCPVPGLEEEEARRRRRDFCDAAEQHRSLLSTRKCDQDGLRVAAEQTGYSCRCESECCSMEWTVTCG